MQANNILNQQDSIVLYKSIINLPLCRFIDCMVDGDFQALVISGTTTNSRELQETWANILQEYSQAIGTGEFKLYTMLYREVSILRLDCDEINCLIQSLNSVQDYILLNKLNVIEYIFTMQTTWGIQINNLLKTNCKFNYKDDPTYREELNKCIRRSKSIKIKLDLKLLAFAAIQNKNTAEVKIDRAYFDSLLITISDHAKYEITENITVNKFCERIKRYNQYCDNLKSKK